MALKPTLYGLSLEEAEELIKELGFPKYRAKQLLDWLYQKHITSFDEAKNLPADLCQKLEEKFQIFSLKMETPQHDRIDSQKFLFQTHDGRFLESVLISQKGRQTVCVSTQLGCKIGCTFCASGKGAFGRNLTVGEVVEQVAWIEKKIGERVSNIVFMGMGEPFDNFETTMKSLRILEKDWGFGISARKITVSTSGIVPGIVEFVKQNQGRIRLSISLHSSIEKKRDELVPINKKYPLSELVRTLKEMNPELSRKITFEYTLIDGENDSEEEARGIVKIAKPLGALVNIIPYNPISEMDYKTPSNKAIQTFESILTKNGIKVAVRQTAGRGIDAACGQLRLDRERSTNF